MHVLRRLLTLAALSPLLGASLRAAESPDVIFVHGRVHTEDAARTVVTAVAIAGNRILATGSDPAIMALKQAGSRVIDLRGRVVMPGIIDAHTHPARFAQVRDKCDLEVQPLPLAGISARIRSCLRTKPGNPALWFVVVGVNPTGVEITRHDLDAITRRPLMLEGSDAHSVWLNSAALRATHISHGTQDPAGGRIERDASGDPTGTLRDTATLLALAAAPAAAEEEEARLLSLAFDDMNAQGITSVQDAAVDDHWMAVYKRLYDQHRLRMRVRGSFLLQDLTAPADALIRDAVAFRARWAVDPDLLRADAVKILADGVIEYPSQTAALLQPYLDENGQPTERRGPDYYSPAHLNEIVAAADAAGLTVHVHAIGDRSTRAALDAFENARRVNGARDNRHQIAHLELVDPEDLARFRATGTIANLQLLWAQRDAYVEAGTIKYLGAERSRHLYPAGSLKRAGALIAGGSDWAVSSFNAFIAMERGITRAERQGAPPLNPEEALTLQDMVDAYTINAAVALRQETTTGSLEAGKRADLIVLDRDIFSLDPYQLHATRVLSTWLDGRELYHTQDFEVH